jgi:hypothetical protein
VANRFTPKSGWLPFEPDLLVEGEAIVLKAGRALARSDTTTPERLAEEAARRSDLSTETAIRVLLDLVGHGWQVRTRRHKIELSRPSHAEDAAEAQRERIRAQHQRAREEQLATPASREFVRSLETRRLHAGHFTSIFSLMRDGRELAPALLELRRVPVAERVEHLRGLIRPYIEFVSDQSVCSVTGFRLQELWRYFRHTWANNYVSVPGRSMMLLVRDAARPMRPVIGIATIGSAVVQSTVRDRWLGWEAAVFLERVAHEPDITSARWLSAVVDRGLREIYVDDLVADKVISRRELNEPSPEAIARLQTLARSARTDHNQGDPRERKRVIADADDDPEQHWLREARSELFRSKRAAVLSILLSAKRTLADAFRGAPSQEGLKRLLHAPVGKRVIAQLVRRAKAESVGIAIADVMVCGAIPPYSHLLGGKLVAMLLASPEVVQAYRERYAESDSVIASSIAGRAIRRPPRLVALSTTSLYGVPLNQYTNVALPCDVGGGRHGERIRYERLGVTLGFGTFQFTTATRKALTELRVRSGNPLGVNWVFGEGVNPRMRAIREGLDVLNLPADEFLNHGSPRVVYGVSLARNAREVLLGMETEPDYFLPLAGGAETSDAIARWWTQRWLAKRIERDDVLQRVASETLVFPIRHGARVQLPPDDQMQLFEA